MRKMLGLLVGGLLFFGMTGVSLAAPNTNNPQVVADYQTGTHGIVGENATHTGSDVVMQAGNSGNFQQWFYGTTPTNTEGDHSIWMSVGSSTSCSTGWDLVTNANQSWGSYLQAGNYCVRTNDYNSH